MSNERGQYGTTWLGADPQHHHGRHGSSLGKWLLGGLVVGGAVLYTQHQQKQIASLYKATGLSHQSFTKSLSERAHSLTSAARSKFHALTSAKKTKAHDDGFTVEGPTGPRKFVASVEKPF